MEFLLASILITTGFSLSAHQQDRKPAAMSQCEYLTTGIHKAFFQEFGTSPEEILDWRKQCDAMFDDCVLGKNETAQQLCEQAEKRKCALDL